ncbi:COG1361 S-layer family protein [Halobaculum sp. CBA1158]|uniref:COG1361 S-layer family protein n=1 Tax=Halobaculum sp. CBA1158 TaxID=2904243 RepID=UPI001F15D396|nr:COG1361 S-layer family protein [Halobaculum sp. CBA1158]UIO99263.1 COG1361 S-layer family protein [Halobaculum sp. CBA1158]
MAHRSLSVLLAALLCVSAVGAGFVGVAAADEDPRFEAEVAEPVLEPGATQELTIELTNDAAEYDEDVEPALDVRATVEDTAGIDVRSNTRDLGRMGDGETRAVSVTIDVPADIPGGTHEVPITVEYRDRDDEDEVLATTVYATVRVEERARFAVEDAESAAPIDGSGPVSLTVRNVGEATARNAVVSFQSGNSDLTFGQSSSARRFVGEWAPNETRTVEVDATVAASAETREYAVDATVEYETPGGTPVASRTLSFGVTPLPEQTFDVSGLESSLRVGEEGQLTGTVTNTGDRPIDNAVVLFETSNPNVSPLEPEVAVGSLAPGESADFAFDIEVSSAAEAGPRQFSLRVQYRDDEDTRRTSDTIDAPASVAQQRDAFGVSGVDASFEVGGGGTLTLEVTNNLEEPVSDVSAKLFLDSPLSSGDDEGFVSELEPGESDEVVFDISVAGGAVAGKTYPASVDFRYETSDGDTLISDTYRVPVETTAPEDDGIPLGAIGVGAALVLGLVGAVYFRRSR